jgi:hypothetical protein
VAHVPVGSWYVARLGCINTWRCFEFGSNRTSNLHKECSSGVARQHSSWFAKADINLSSLSASVIVKGREPASVVEAASLCCSVGLGLLTINNPEKAFEKGKVHVFHSAKFNSISSFPSSYDIVSDTKKDSVVILLPTFLKLSSST